MELVTGVKKKETLELRELLEAGRIGTEVRVNGAIHTIRDMGTVAFIILRKREGLVQCVYEEGVSKFNLKDVKEADTVEVSGMLERSEKAPNGIEIRLGELKILSEPAEPMPLPISKWKLNTSLEAKLNYRPISLRNIRERAKFRIQEGIVRGFRDFLYQEGFTEIHTPKIGAKSAEGGANLFRLEYFHRPAILQQSPQFYKQMMVGVLTVYLRLLRYSVQKSIIPSDTSTNTPALILRWDISMDLKILWQWRPDFFSIRWLCLKKSMQES